MLRYVRNQPPGFSAQALVIHAQGQIYYPCIHHTAVGQNRPIGQAETFREHAHDLYHIVVYMKSQGAFLLDNQRVEATPGMIACVSPGQRHDFVSFRQQAVYSEVTFSFETEQGRVLDASFAELLQHYVGTSLTMQPWQQATLEKAGQLESLILQITDHAQSGAPIAPYCCQRSLARLLDTLAQVSHLDS
jgi:hypothetical protein